MSFGWFLMINGILGIVIFYVSFPLFMVWLCDKYGGENADEGLDHVREQSDMIGDQATGGQINLWLMLAYFLTFFLWEIEIPIKYYVIWQNVKSLNEVRNEKEEIHHE